jgi:hypothetical protein
LRQPADSANRARNARAEFDRHARWAPAREALWRVLDSRLARGARVAVLGAGNGDDLPLDRIAGRAGQTVLIDLDAVALRSARRRQPRRLRDRIEVIEHDATGGAADTIAISASRGEAPFLSLSESLLPGAPYDLVIGDLLYSQLLYPALLDLTVPAPRRAALLDCYGPLLTRAVVERLHASAPRGAVLHLHDPLAWWRGHVQPIPLDDILDASKRDTSAALALTARGHGPHNSDLSRPARPISRSAR